MKTKSILLLLLIASAMIQVFLYFCICVFVFVLILAMIQDQALVGSKHFLVETEDKNVADNAVEPPVDIGTESGEPVMGRSCPRWLCSWYPKNSIYPKTMWR